MYLAIEKIIGCAFLHILKISNGEKRCLTLDVIERYGKKVNSILLKKGTVVSIELSRNKFNDFLYYYSDYFEKEYIRGKIAIKFKDNMPKEILPDIIIADVDIITRNALMHKEALKVLSE